MIVLGLDSSTLTASVAVLRDGEVIAEEDARADIQAEALLPLIARVLERAGVAPRSLDAVAVGAGPGSFTGLRIGMATAKGVAFAAGCPLWAVSSLQALARSARGAAPVLVAALDARRGEIYAGVFADDDALTPLAPERALAPGALAATVADARAVVLGDALDVYPDLGLPAVAGARRTPSGADVARLALNGDHPDVLTTGGPVYVRLAEAEVLYPDGVPGARRVR